LAVVRRLNWKTVSWKPRHSFSVESLQVAIKSGVSDGLVDQESVTYRPPSVYIRMSVFESSHWGKVQAATYGSMEWRKLSMPTQAWFQYW
jgi:hypothetical protein